MPAYVIADIDVHDIDAFKEYAALVQATLEPFQGHYLVRGGACEALEGNWQPERFIVLQFPSADLARGWYTSPEYAKVMAIRHRSSTGRLILAHGVEP